MTEKMIQNTMDTLDLEVQLALYQVELNNHLKFVETIPLMEEADATNIDRLFDETSKMLDAARRGLGLTNKLKDSASRTKFRSRVMGNLNRIRAKLARITKALQTWYGMDDPQQSDMDELQAPSQYDAAMMDPESER